MLRGTVTALMRSTDAAGVLVVGGLLTLLAWVVTPVWVGGSLLFPPLVLLAPLALAPAFVARGYFVRVLAAGVANGNAEGAPAFVAWNDLYRNGLKSALLSAVLLAPLGLVIGVVALAGGVLRTGPVDPAPAADVVRTALGDGGVTAVIALAGGLVGAISAVYLVAFAYVRPAALAAFAASGRLRDGFRPRRVARLAGSSAYAAAWVVAAATLGAGYALAGPFVPVVIGLALVFVVRVAAYGLYGRGAAATIDVVEPIGVDESVDPTAADAVRVGRSNGRAYPRIPEVPPAVQTGRTVPLDGVTLHETGAEVVCADGSASHRTGGALGADGGFDWYAPGGESGERERGGAVDTASDDGTRARNAASTEETAAGGDEFEWSVDVADPEDKS
ncbi:DUF4013 domain-containing protein [Halorubrum sp. N11]|uniref:DUF4013 domain-containing protein n=1 Tax=Halorubrum sp. N11 TaxID=3402276 RepID=UPI003EBEF981